MLLLLLLLLHAHSALSVHRGCACCLCLLLKILPALLCYHSLCPAKLLPVRLENMSNCTVAEPPLLLLLLLLLLLFCACALPPLQALLSRGLQHSNPLVVSATLLLLQRCLDATAALLLPLERAAVATATTAAQLAAAAADLRRVTVSCTTSTDDPPAAPVCAVQQQDDASAAADEVVQALSHAEQRWRSTVTALRAAARLRVPEPSVLVALLTAQQRAGARTAHGHNDGGAVVEGQKAARGKPAGAAESAELSQQQPVSCRLTWQLLEQTCGVLASYARLLPDVLVDGQVDLHRLLLQAQVWVLGIQQLSDAVCCLLQLSAACCCLLLHPLASSLPGGDMVLLLFLKLCQLCH
jgi:hypothetical protein